MHTEISHLVTVHDVYRALQDGPESNTARAILWPDQASGPWVVILEWGQGDGRAECIGVELRSFRKPGEESWLGMLPLWDGSTSVSTQVWRDLPLATIVRDLRREMATGSLELLDWLAKAPEWASEQDQSAIRRLAARPKAELAGPASLPLSTLAETADIYRRAFAAGANPTSAVAEALTISKSAAAKRVSRAREAGYLPATTRGRPGINNTQETS